MQDQTSDAFKSAKIIERVRALLAMTTKNGCTEAEAIAAAAKAAELLEQYDLELKDVKSLEDERIAQQSRPFASDGRPREMHAAGIYVSLAIANFFDCKCWRSGIEVIFFGMKDDVELAHAMLSMIRLAMDRELMDFMAGAGKGAGHPRSVMVSFMKGMGHRLSNRLTQIKAERTAHVRAKGKDLVVVKGNLVEAAYAELMRGLNLKPRPLKPVKNALAYFAGVQAADRVNLGSKEIKDSQTSPIPDSQSHFYAGWIKRKSGPRSKLVTWISHLGNWVRTWIMAVSSLGFIAAAFAVAAIFNEGFYPFVAVPFAKCFPQWYADGLTILGGPFSCCAAIFLRGRRLQEEQQSLWRWRGMLEASRLRPSPLTRLRHQGEIALWCFFIYLGSQLGPYLEDLHNLTDDQPAHAEALKQLSNPNLIFAHLAVGTCWIVLGCLLADALWGPRAFLGQAQAARETRTGRSPG